MRPERISAIHLRDNDGNDIGELSVDAGTLLSANMVLEINGEHSISLTTQRRLHVGMYCYTKHRKRPDGYRIREWVVDEEDQEHSSGKNSTGTYHLIWSLQYELQGTRANDVQQPGMDSVNGCSAKTAMQAAFSGVLGWRTSSTVETTSHCIMAYDSAWDRLNTVVKYWGGNVDDEIYVDSNGRVKDRLCKLLAHQGDYDIFRRLEWGHDMTSINRNVSAGPYYCRVIPYGKGESLLSDDGETSYERPLMLTDGGYARDYVSNTMAEQAFRKMTPEGYYYPITSVNYDTDDPFVLFEMVKADAEELTTPDVTYSATVSQFAEAGMDIHDIELGDEIQVVDVDFWKDFGVDDAEPLRTEERVVRIEVDLLGIEDERIEIGKLKQTLERLMSGMMGAVGQQAVVEAMSPIVATPYDYDIPQHETYTIDTPEGDVPISYEPAEYTPYDYDSRISDLETIIAGLVDYDPGVDVDDYDPDTGETTQLFGTGALTTGKLTAGAGGGDQWVHQIDGVTYSTGVVNFVTTKQGGTPSTPSPSPSTPSTPSSSTSQKTTKTDRRTAQQEQNALRNVKARSGKDTKKTDTPTTNKDTTAAKSTFAITAANINGNKAIDLNDPWKSSAAGSGELVDPGKFLLDAIDNLFSGGNSGGHSF